MSSTESTPPFDAQAAAQQMLALQARELSDRRVEASVMPSQPSPHSVAPPSRARYESGTSFLPPSLTDRGNAILFVRLYRDRFRHVEGLGWFVWDGYRW
ncbi:DNA primase, partial [Streptomyces misionensis]